MVLLKPSTGGSTVIVGSLEFADGRAGVQVAVKGDRVLLTFQMPGVHPQTFAFLPDQAERIGELMLTAGARPKKERTQ